jgi:hypothetical protein
MQRLIRNIAGVVMVSVWVGMFSPGSWQAAFVHAEASASEDMEEAALFPGERFARTELFFGSKKPDGSEVTDEDFRGFLRQVVTPLFPNGLTLLTGRGQFLNADEKIIRERSWLLILLYPVEARQDSSGKIERIRELYKQEFRQESVLRADRCCVPAVVFPSPCGRG